MELLKQLILWGIAILGAVIAAWVKGLFNLFFPSPQRAKLAIANKIKTKSLHSKDRFRIVLCWLENDDGGRNTKTVAEAFSGIGGIELVRSTRIVAASGAADDWLPAIRKSTRKVLDQWKADLAIIGLVKKSGEALNLWFVPREGDGTLPRGDKPYVLKDVSLQEDFREHLYAQLVAEALRAVEPLVDTEVRGRILVKELYDAVKKLEALLIKSDAIIGSERRAALSLAYGNALAILGERESGTERLEQAVDAYNEALKVYTRERPPLQWAMTQNNLGNTLQTLGERESGTERLDRAVCAYTKALEEYTRERVPLDWAMTQNNLGNALQTLGGRESGTGRLEQAVRCLHAAALDEFTRESGPLNWARNAEQSRQRPCGLGRSGRAGWRRLKYLKQAVHAYTEALKERTRERVPLDWAATQNNLGNALEVLGERESGTGRLERAVEAYNEALKEHTRERAPLQWTMMQNNLGNVLAVLGGRESGTGRLEQAVCAYTKALEEYTRERVPLQWAMTQHNLGNALRTLGGAGERDGASGAGRGCLQRGPQGTHPRARAVPVGQDAVQSRQRPSDIGRAGERDGASEAGRGCLQRGPQGTHPRVRAAPVGHDTEQPRQRPSDIGRAGERDGAPGAGRGCLQRGNQGAHSEVTILEEDARCPCPCPCAPT